MSWAAVPVPLLHKEASQTLWCKVTTILLHSWILWLQKGDVQGQLCSIMSRSLAKSSGVGSDVVNRGCFPHGPVSGLDRLWSRAQPGVAWASSQHGRLRTRGLLCGRGLPREYSSECFLLHSSLLSFLFCWSKPSPNCSASRRGGRDRASPHGGRLVKTLRTVF